MTDATDIDRDLRTDGRISVLRRPGYFDIEVPCLFDTYTPTELVFGFGTQDLIRATDSKVLMTAILPSGVVPDPDLGDTIDDDDGTPLRIITATPVRPGNELLFYWIQARR